ncbi:MAG: ABC transporter substrate-binding protein [Candidatus Bipolaricaulota bacterium]|nr:ABC transporter substrate-binding protein [Candidatus Bipolaricaulota bacterium]
MKKITFLFAVAVLLFVTIGVADPVVEFTDALGRVIAFDVLPERIVVAGKGSWMVGHPLYLFPEAVDRVVAMEVRRGSVSDFLAQIVPGFSELPHLETNAGPEQIAPLQPDAVVLKSYMRELGDSLELIGLPVVYVHLETPEQFFADIKTIGQLFDSPTRTDEIIAFYKQRLDKISARVDTLSAEERPSVLVIQYIERGGEGAFSVPPTEWMQTIQVKTAGGDPVWFEASGTGWQVVNFEQIAAWDPDKIFVVVFRSDPDPVMEHIRSNPNWQALSAVQNDELYAFPADFFGWDVPDPRWILGLTWCAKTIHPGLLSDVDIRQEIYDFYGQMYRMDEAEVEEIILPQLSGDID